MKFNLADTSVYNVGQNNQKVLIIFSNIFGAYSSRHRNIADTYASFGYNVYLPQLLLIPDA
jgi:dienelactone hydrolase